MKLTKRSHLYQNNSNEHVKSIKEIGKFEITFMHLFFHSTFATLYTLLCNLVFTKCISGEDYYDLLLIDKSYNYYNLDTFIYLVPRVGPGMNSGLIPGAWS